MKFLILNTDYPEFLQWLYGQKPGIEEETYEKQIAWRAASLFGVADFYSNNLRNLGHEAREIHANNDIMQKTWARENGVDYGDSLLRLGKRVSRKIKKTFTGEVSSRTEPDWFYKILSAQIRSYEPDVILNQDLRMIPSEFLKGFKTRSRLIVGQNASFLPNGIDLSAYDLLLSSLPNRIEQFRRQGLRAELHPFAFDPRVLNAVADIKRNNDSVTFVGSVTPEHTGRIELLERLCREFDISVYGNGFEFLPEGSVIRQKFRGNAWGIEMYRILKSSAMTINQHINLSDGYVNNMRLYEATGTGTLLITDFGRNLREIFEPGREVIAYQTPDECEKSIAYYLNHSKELEEIAINGQNRTLHCHTYLQRMRELVATLSRYT